MRFHQGIRKTPDAVFKKWHGYGPGVTISRAIVTPGNHPGKNRYKQQKISLLLSWLGGSVELAPG
jgi:hypothetical protein